MQRLLSLFSTAEVRELDRIAIEERGIPGIVLMKRAGLEVFRAMSKLDASFASVTVLCGRGNNAGDGYIVAGYAADHGMDVQLLQLGLSDALRGDAALARDWAHERGVVEEQFDSASELRGEVLVDALLGTGLTGLVRDEFAAAIDAINRCVRPIVSVDIPSGLSADTGVPLGRAVSSRSSTESVCGNGFATISVPERFTVRVSLPADSSRAESVSFRGRPRSVNPMRRKPTASLRVSSLRPSCAGERA